MERTDWGSSVFSSEGDIAGHAGDNEAESDNNDRVYSRGSGEILDVLSLSLVSGIVNSRYELEQKMAERNAWVLFEYPFFYVQFIAHAHVAAVLSAYC